MSKIEIPASLIKNLGPEMKMDVHWIDARLNDGSYWGRLVVQGGRYITGRHSAASGEGPLPFRSEQVHNIRRAALFGRLWPLWPKLTRA